MGSSGSLPSCWASCFVVKSRMGTNCSINSSPGHTCTHVTYKPGVYIQVTQVAHRLPLVICCSHREGARRIARHLSLQRRPAPLVAESTVGQVQWAISRACQLSGCAEPDITLGLCIHCRSLLFFHTIKHLQLPLSPTAVNSSGRAHTRIPPTLIGNPVPRQASLNRAVGTGTPQP